MRRNQIALQLYTVRELAAADLRGTLAAVATAGYRAVEVAGIRETARASLPGLLRDAGLAVVAVHEGIEAFRADRDAVVERLAALGTPRVIAPSIPDEERRTIADVRAFAAEVNALAPQLADRGIRVGYHNHAFEFAPLEGTTVWDVLGDELAPDVELEIDVYWASVGGRDPAAVIRAAGERVRLLHMKDRAVGSEPHDAPAGEGSLEWRAIVAAGRDAGVEWYIAEQDDPGDAIRDVTAARVFLDGLADPAA